MIDHLDQLVLPTAHEADGIRFCTQALGLRLSTFAGAGLKGTGSLSFYAFEWDRRPTPTSPCRPARSATSIPAKC